MARKPSKNLTERELEIMLVIWDRTEADLDDVRKALNRHGEPVAPSTVATQLKLLCHKGFLNQKGRPGHYVYTPTCSRANATKSLLDAFLARIGLARSPSFLIELLKAEKLSAQDRAALQAILHTRAGQGTRTRRAEKDSPASSKVRLRRGQRLKLASFFGP
jgi:predicted transcriptional regulator